MSGRFVREITIESGQTTSNIVSLEDEDASLVGIRTPDVFDGVSFTFLAAPEEDGDFKVMTRAIDGLAVTAIVDADNHVALVVEDFFAASYIQLVSSATETGDRTIELVMKHA